jgi:7-keto-8-aminopelargonate synthetase-like enzyme/acyl-CoA synthetase (AMP-forming)/AMP-acid ligase II/acyl carrier protein
VLSRRHGSKRGSDPGATCDLMEFGERATMKKTLYDFVLEHANNNDTGGVTFPDENLELDWPALVLRANACAAGLSSTGIGHESVIFLCGRNSSTLLSSFLGAQRAGATPSILAPKMNGTSDFIESLLLKIRIARPSALLLGRTVADDEYEELKSSLRRSLEKPYADQLKILRFEEINIQGANLPDVKSSSLAFLQFTSGSVLNPRACQISHENVEANCRAMIEQSQIVASDVWVSWLPLFHDMGLVGATGLPIISGGRLVLVDPSRFIENPTVWLKLVSKHRATMTVAPNMAYSICATKIPSTRLAGIDLSSLRRVFNGSEPINWRDLEAFANRMAPLGFRKAAFLPCYGLAECTLAVTFSVSPDGYSLVRANASALEREGVFSEAQDGKRALEIVSVGEPIPQHQIRIVDPVTNGITPENLVGEIQVKGPSVALGYLGDEFPVEEDGWLKTGDLGFIHRGELYVVGRLKDLIKKAGRSIFPTDIETLASQVDGVRAGGAVAFEFQRNQRTQIGLVVESKKNDEGRQLLAQALRRRIVEGLSLALDAAWIVPPKTIPKTTSGKLQRKLAARMAESGRFGPPAINEIDLGEVSAPSDHLREVISEVKPSLAGRQFSLDVTWAELGIDSLDLQSIIAGLEERLDLDHVDGQVGNVHSPAALLHLIQPHFKRAGSNGESRSPREKNKTAEAVESTDGVKVFAYQLRLGTAMSLVTAAQCDDVRHKSALFAAVREWTEKQHGALYNVYLKGGSAPRSEITIGGMSTKEQVRIFSTNHYLGLHRHPDVVKAARQAVETHGAGVGTSAPSGGYTEIHRRLEDSLTTFVGKESGIIFPTGYTANLGTISALCGQGDRVIVDKEIHASVIDGCRLSGAAIESFRHNDVGDLERVLNRAHAGTTLVVVESVYSMGGEDSELASIIKTAHAHGALVMVDESHSFGFYGNDGAGLSEACGVLGEVDLFMTTMSKSLASLGGFVAGNRDLIDLIRWSSRAFIFQACATPASIASAEAALELIIEGYGREQLWMNTRRFREGVAQIGLASPGSSPIVTVPARTAAAARHSARALLKLGVFAPAITHPAVALDESRLRFTVTASHTAEDIDCALDALEATKGLLCADEESWTRTGEVVGRVGGNRGGFAELAASAERLREMMTGSAKRLAIEAHGCPKILIEDAYPCNTAKRASMTIRGDVGMLLVGSPTELIDRIASGRLTAEGDLSSLAWLCFAIKRTGSAPVFREYEIAAD